MFVEMATFEKKIKGGKLVKVIVEGSKTINDIKILGDFFAYPEEAIFELEKALKGKEIKKETIELLVRSELKRRNAVLVGLNEEDLIYAIEKAAGA
ncbi:MAG: lipoate protein ligase C-terminal domain-containing protein [Candidatus Micrarchaeaceae archaeon]